MWSHMLPQFPLLMGAGALLARSAGAACAWRLCQLNAHGITGLVWVAGVLSVLMVPRVLDLSCATWAWSLLKCAALVLGGARRCACPGGRRGWWCSISLGMLLPMMVVGPALHRLAAAPVQRLPAR